MAADGPIYMKYDVARTDRAEEDPASKHFGGCRYFVLDVDHDPYAAAGLLGYAAACRETHPQLAQAIYDLAAGLPVEFEPHP